MPDRGEGCRQPGDERNGGLEGRDPGDSGGAGRGGAATQRSAETREGAGEAVALHSSQDLNPRT